MTNDATISVTANEASALHGIRQSEYSDGDGQGVWVFSIKASTKGKALGGVLSSLKKKGLIVLGEEPRPNLEAGTDAYANLTEAGLAFVTGKPGFKTVAARASKIVPSAEPAPAVTTPQEPKETTATPAPSVRPQTEKLKALNLLMCGRGRLFGIAGTCRCCGASGALIEVREPEMLPAKKSRTRKPKGASMPTISDATRAKNADAKAARAAKRAGTALASVGSGS
jgi:hypothetical protein